MGPGGLIWLLVHQSDYTIADNWFVSGLKGTGSKDVLVHEVFVPEYRVVSVADLRRGQSPGRAIHKEDVLPPVTIGIQPEPTGPKGFRHVLFTERAGRVGETDADRLGHVGEDHRCSG